jgi:hypothetical protein
VEEFGEEEEEEEEEAEGRMGMSFNSDALTSSTTSPSSNFIVRVPSPFTRVTVPQ